ncbi:MAG: peptidoglycan-binding protein [Oscillospiraceae bacterium]|nr:peptidoglycan-binding protein [Oscillospiraceae bacterium]
MTRKFMVTYENPADQSEEAINDRFRLAQAIYYEFAGKEVELPSDDNTNDTISVNPTAPIASYWPPRMVDKTMQGPDVAVLQAVLTARGYYTAGIDSYFGETTESAVLDFQRNNSLAADAIVGPLTWAKLVKIQ